MTTKICSKCKVEKDMREFYKDTRLKSLHMSKCKQCKIHDSRAWRVDNPDKALAAISSLEDRRRNQSPWKERFAIGSLVDQRHQLRLEKHRHNKELSRETKVTYVSTLSDNYVKSVLNVPNPPQELIELKRLQLQIHRELKQQGEVK